MIQLKPYWHDHGNIILCTVDVMLQSTTITILSTGQLNELFANSFFPTNVLHKVHRKLECLVATVNDHTMILVFLSCKKFTVTKIVDTYKSHLV
jgi:hypothetical protein